MGPIELGRTAQRLLDDDLVKEIFATLEARYVKSWKDATVPEARDAWWYRVKALEDVVQELRRLRDSGTRAERTAP